MTRTKKITCLDGVTRDCERLLSNDGWGYLDHRDGLGTVLVCIPDTNIEGNTQIPGNVPNTSTSSTNLFGPLIYSYSRSDALADGALIDVSTMATEAGFTVHTAMTLTAWCDCVAWDDEAEAHKLHGTGQDEAGRLWDVLQAARLAVRSTGSGNRATFQLRRLPSTGRSTRPQLAALEVVIGPGDAGEPVITIMQPGED